MLNNCNIFRGVARYVRLKRSLMHMMWNITVRAARKQDIEGIQQFLKPNEENMEPIGDVVFDDILLGKNLHHFA